VSRGVESLPPELFTDQAAAALEGVGARGLLSAESTDRQRQDLQVVAESAAGEPLLPVLVASSKRDDWSVDSPVIDPDDRWAICYMGTFGALPQEPLNRHLLEAFGLRPGLSWSDIVDVSFTPVTGGAQDVLDRLRDARHIVPTKLSCALIATAPAGRHSSIYVDGDPLPQPDTQRALVGPNIVVVYEPGSVADLALLWNLRAAHGLPRGLPLAVPTTVDVPEVLRSWRDQHVSAYFGLGGDRTPRLVSCSVATDTLKSIAAHAGTWEAGDWSEVRQVGRRPGRPSVQLVDFSKGKARMTAWTAEDRIELGTRLPYSRDPDLKFTIAPLTRWLPPSASLRPAWWTHAGYREWGYQTDDRGADSLINVEWPAGWEVLKALLADRGLRAEPSPAGVAAATFLARLGSWRDVQMILTRPVLDELHRLGTARSMTWFRERARGIAKAVEAADDSGEALRAIEAKLDEMNVRASEEERSDATIENWKALFSRNRHATASWIRWAERQGLLVRGVGVECERCKARSWRAIGELAPPLTCRGCGEIITHPYPEGELKFRYGATEPLLRLIEADSLPHLLAMRFFCALWAPNFERPSPLFGGYPGVDIYEQDSGEKIGEADVLLVLSSGRVVPGECKRREAGLNAEELQKLDRLVERLDAPWSFIATTDWAAECRAIWPESVRYAPDPRPRIALTADQLLRDHVASYLGVNPFAWEPLDADARADQHTQFVATIEQFGDSLTDA
jgi:hypothetical protein